MGAPVLLVATESALRPAMQVLAMQVADLDHAPAVTVAEAGAVAAASDDAQAAGAWLDAAAPGLIVLAGAVLPVPLIEAARARGIALMLVEAREPVLSGRWRLLPWALKAQLRGFAQIHAVDAPSAASLARLLRGAPVALHETGALARHAPARGCNASELDALRDALRARPAWFAYGLPASEAEAALLAHAHALRRAHRLLMIVQPRDPGIGASLAERAGDVGFVCARRSLEQDIDETTQVYIADTDDDPGLFLRLAPVAFLGGSLTQGAGAPPAIAAAALGSALAIGPWPDPAETDFIAELIAEGGARRIGLAPALGEVLSALLAPETGADAALKAWTLATRGSEATLAVARAIADWWQLQGRKP